MNEPEKTNIFDKYLSKYCQVTVLALTRFVNPVCLFGDVSVTSILINKFK